MSTLNPASETLVNKTVTYNGLSPKGTEISLSLTIGAATAGMGMYRSLLIDEAELEVKTQPDAAPDRQKDALKIMRIFMYPSMIAAVLEHSGFDQWPITFEEFSGLPEMFVIEWERAVFTLNPHWKVTPTTPETKAQKRKKATSSTSA